MWSRFLLQGPLLSPSQHCPECFPSPHNQTPHLQQTCHLSRSRLHCCGVLQANPASCFLSPVCDIRALPWGSVCEPWPHPGAGWAAWAVCAAAKAALHVCSGQSDSNPCLVPHTTWLDHAVKRETTGLRQLKPPALLKIQQMQGEQRLP